ncbi:MAG: glycosyltransferase family 4 protein [Candidatus Heimdallarchaeota archaeon]
MKVLVLTTTFPRYVGDSVPAFVYYLCKSLSKLGVDITVLAPHTRTKRYGIIPNMNVQRFDYFLNMGYGLPPKLKTRGFGKYRVLFLTYSMWKHAKYLSKTVDIVHGHWLFPSGYVASKLQKPYVMTAYGIELFLAKNNVLLRRFLRPSVEGADRIIAISKNTARRTYELFPSANTRIIRLGFSPLEPKNQEEEQLKNTILFVGRLVKRKGVEYLLRAVKQLENRVPVNVIIVGDGPERKNLEMLVHDLNLDNVTFYGWIPQRHLKSFYQRASIFVLPAITDPTGDTEGLGIVQLEAMSCGVPVIASRVGGITDTITDGKTGLLVEEKDSQQLAEAIEVLLKDKELRSHLVTNAFKVVKTEFSWERIAQRILREYKAILNSKIL